VLAGGRAAASGQAKDQKDAGCRPQRAGGFHGLGCCYA